MFEYFRRLFAYDDWANREVLGSLKTSVSAERLWLERLEQRKQTYPVWPEFSLAQCEAEAADLAALWQKYFGENKLAEMVSYKNTKGESWTNSVEDILMHVVMHSAYHRGQIAADMRAAGHSPAYTDFIHGIRQRLVE